MLVDARSHGHRARPRRAARLPAPARPSPARARPARRRHGRRLARRGSCCGRRRAGGRDRSPPTPTSTRRTVASPTSSARPSASRASVPLAPARMDWLKLVGFVPEGDVESVRAAIFAAGAGTDRRVHPRFLRHPRSGDVPSGRPLAPRRRRDRRRAEARASCVSRACSRASCGARVVDAFVAAHSYEEPAFNVYPIENEVRTLGPRAHRLVWRRPRPLEAFAAERRGAVRLAGRSATRAPPSGWIEAVAVVPGSGASLIDQAAAAGVGALVTGDVKYHDAERAERLGLALIDAPHEVVEGAPPWNAGVSSSPTSCGRGTSR